MLAGTNLKGRALSRVRCIIITISLLSTNAVNVGCIPYQHHVIVGRHQFIAWSSGVKPPGKTRNDYMTIYTVYLLSGDNNKTYFPDPSGKLIK